MNAVQRFIIAPGEGKAFVVKKGQVLRIIEVEGKQVADVAIFNAHDYKECFHVGQTLALNMIEGTGNIWRVKKLYSKPPRENVMFTVIDDKAGVHFLLSGGRCSRKIYELRDKAPGHRNCQDILAEALSPYGLSGDDIMDVFNVFMNVEIDEEGRFIIKPPKTEKGDYIDLLAEMDCLVAVSACPSDKVPTNDFKPKPIGIEILEGQQRSFANRAPLTNRCINARRIH
jgi:uncharacterized protein YcgI (DUF1989 family)